MDKIIIVDEITGTEELEQYYVRYVREEELDEALKQEEFDIIYVRIDFLTEKIEKRILTDYLTLPNILQRLKIDKHYTTFIGLQFINRLIMNNIKTVELNGYYEEVAIENRVKNMLLGEVNLQQADIPDLDKETRRKAEKAVKDVIIRHYTQNSFIRHLKYFFNRDKIEELFFSKILHNINREIDNIKSLRGRIKGTNIEKTKIVIADDNIEICNRLREYLQKFADIEIVGIAHNDEEERNLIDTLKPKVVITDLIRNHKYTGLDIIEEYEQKNRELKFLVISADIRNEIIKGRTSIEGYIQKPFNDYYVVRELINKIKEKEDNFENIRKN